MNLISYKYRLYPNNKQVSMLSHTFGCVCFDYNSALGYSKEQYDLGNRTNYNDCCNGTPETSLSQEKPGFFFMS